MKKLLLFLIAVIVGFAANADKTIYYDNSDTKWGSVKIWHWGSSDSDAKQMTLVAGNFYKGTVPSDHSILFFDGSNDAPQAGSQTGDISSDKVIDGHLYNGDTDKGVYTVTISGDYNIIYSGDKVNIFYWGGASGSSWPGVAMTTAKGSDGKTYKVYKLPEGTTNVIFNTDGDNNKTGDLSYSGKSGFIFDDNGATAAKVIFQNNTPNPPVDDKKYTIYFYDTKSYGSMKAHVWSNGGDLYRYTSDYEKMERAYNDNGEELFVKKSTSEGTRYYPVYKLSFDWTKTPSKVLFYVSGDSNKQTGDLAFVNKGVYTNSCSGSSNDALVTKPKEYRTIYMHWKEDFVKKGDKDAPYCMPLSSDKYDDTDNIKRDWLNKMYCVNEKYQIWAYDLTDDEYQKCNNIIFAYFEPNNDKRVDWYLASKAPNYDRADWTKYIYTVHNGNYCPQTYLTYDEFLSEADKGYRNLYIVGSEKFNLTIRDKEDKVISDASLSWDLDKMTKLEPDTEGEPLYFLELTPTFDGDTPRFKVTWMDVSAYKAKIGNDKRNSDRDWATFDLGIIGVNDILCEENKNVWTGVDLKIEPSNDVNKWDTGRAFFKPNKSLPLLEYNQYDWSLTSDRAGGYSKFWAVIDLHESCRTVTLCSFNPQPSVEGTAGEIKKHTLTAEQAKLFHGEKCLEASRQNGHVLMTAVNYCSADLTIKGAKDANGNEILPSVVNDAKFSRRFDFNLNGKSLFYKNSTGTYTVDFMPLASESDMNITTTYTSDVTKLTFHSRPGDVTLGVGDNFEAPYVESPVNGEYTYKDGEMRVYARLQVNLDHGNISNYYSDVTVQNGYAAQFAPSDDPYIVANAYPAFSWTPYNDDSAEWDAETFDWSTKAVDTFNNIEKVMPLFIRNAVDPMEVGEDNILPRKEFKVNVYAVYPILYQTEPTVTDKDMPASALSAGASRAVTVPDDLDGFAISYFRLPGEATVTTPGNVTGIEDVEATEEVTDADAPVEYYTISGVRVVGDPAPGIYIVRKGNKVTKQVIR